jgi:hypothetical protein
LIDREYEHRSENEISTSPLSQMRDPPKVFPFRPAATQRSLRSVNVAAGTEPSDLLVSITIALRFVLIDTKRLFFT